MSVSLGVVIGKTECLILYSDIILACVQRWKSWILFKMRWCSTAIYKTSLVDRWKKTKAFITKRSDCLKRKGKHHRYMDLCPSGQKQQQFCSCQRLWIWVIPKMKWWSGIMIQCLLSWMYFTVPNYLHFFQSVSLFMIEETRENERYSFKN